jgi:hypothetical protein
MEAIRRKIGVVQNTGLADRILRAVLATLMLGIPAFDLVVNEAVVTWHGISMLLAVYPALTAILGWDPFYQLGNAKTCDTSDRNRCGTLPFEVSAAMGHDPKCQSDYDCHLEETGGRRAHAQ